MKGVAERNQATPLSIERRNHDGRFEGRVRDGTVEKRRASGRLDDHVGIPGRCIRFWRAGVIEAQKLGTASPSR